MKYIYSKDVILVVTLTEVGRKDSHLIFVPYCEFLYCPCFGIIGSEMVKRSLSCGDRTSFWVFFLNSGDM